MIGLIPDLLQGFVFACNEFERFVSEHIRKCLAQIELDEVKRTQESQQDHLRVMELVLPLLLPKPEQQHLLNLGAGNTSQYQGNPFLRSELRRLRFDGFSGEARRSSHW
jgi:hypothetical protein